MADRRIDQLAPATQVNATDLFVIEQNNIAKQVAASNIGTAVMRSNPNLLDNWYFPNPVNQRGKLVYTPTTSNTYTIDRWCMESSSASQQVSVNTDGTIKIVNDTGEDNKQFKQMLEIAVPVGYTITLSAIVTSVTGTVRMSYALSGSPYTSFVNKSTMTVGLNTASGKVTASGSCKVFFSLSSGASINLKAVKLEIGNQQTLAHEDNGSFVLNEIPDYGEQLRRCRRFYIPSTNRWDIAFYAVGDGINYQLPFESMRCQPSLSTTTTQVFDAVKGWVDITGAVCRYGDNGKMAIVWNGLSNLSTPYQSVYLVGNNTPALIADL